MWVLDTNVLSELRVKRPSESVLAFIAEEAPHRFYTTDVNIAEIRAGVAAFSGTDQGVQLETWLNTVIRPWLSTRILHATEERLLKWLQVGRDVQRKKGPTPPADLLIAAIAMDAGMKVATRDTAPFVAAGVPTFNPFTGERFNGA